MYRGHRLAQFVLPALLVAFLSGCGSGPRLVPIKGTVTYNGAPLTSGTLVFAPDEPGKVQPGTGTIGSDGRFSVVPDGGLMAGSYRVFVQSQVVGPVKTPPTEPAKIKIGGLAIPKRYTDPTTSGLTITVSPADAGKEHKFELTD